MNNYVQRAKNLLENRYMLASYICVVARFEVLAWLRAHLRSVKTTNPLAKIKAAPKPKASHAKPKAAPKSRRGKAKAKAKAGRKRRAAAEDQHDPAD